MLNKIVLQGRLTAEPELKTTQSNIAYLDFTVAWNNKYRDIEKVCFLRCKAWRNTAELVFKWFHKGQEIIVEGNMVTERWKDKEGNNKSTLVCEVEQVHFTSGKTQQAETGTSETKQSGMSLDDFLKMNASDEDELPFK